MNLPAPGSWRCWLLAARPKTLFAAIAPVMIGSAMAAADGVVSLPAGVAALFGALLIQIGTNLANDYWDGIKGTDTADRLGPPRTVATGLLPAKTVLVGTFIAFGLASIAGLVLLYFVGWPVLLIGGVSIACGLAYTAGPLPLAYVGLGDLFTFIFFGLVATAGTYFVHTGKFGLPSLLAGAMPGFYSVVLIALNNLRDMDGDRKAGKWTLAARFGGSFARTEIYFCMVLAALTPVFLAFLTNRPSVGVASALTILGLWETTRFARALSKLENTSEINTLFPRVGAISLLMAALLSVAHLC